MSTEVKIAKRPDCDVCKMSGVITPALYDVKTKFGAWAYCCERCFDEVSLGILGTGFGQRLVVDDDVRP